MRVLFLNPAGALGGAEQSLLDVMISLRAHEPRLVTKLLLMAPGELVEVARGHGFDVELAPLPNGLARLGESATRSVDLGAALEAGGAAFALPSYLLELRRRVARFAPSLVHTNGVKAHLIAALALRRFPIAAHVRDFLGGRKVGRRVLGLLPEGSVVIANSEAVASDVRALAPRLAVRVVHNAIDTDFFTPDRDERAPLADLAGLAEPGPGALAVGLVATYAAWKGQKLFLEAAARVVARRPESPVCFFVVGGPIYDTKGSQVTRDELERCIAELGLEGKAGLVPFQRDVARVYRALDVVVHASVRPEPFGRTIVEAMACGRAVIVARAGGAPELFEEGRTALGFEPSDPQALADAITRLLDEPALREQLSRAAAREARSRFSRARLGPEISAVYRELLGGAV